MSEPWGEALRALKAVLDEALAHEDILEALHEKRISVKAARKAVLESKSVLAQLRTEQERLSEGLLLGETSDDYPEYESLSAKDVLWLLVIFMLGVGYLSLVRASWSALPLGFQVFVIAGFVPVLGLSARLAVAGIPWLTAWLGLDPFSVRSSTDPAWSLGHRRLFVLNEIVLPELRQFINSQREPLYNTTLTAVAESSLYADDPAAEVVVTSAAKHLQRILSRGESGAVALAGHRGTGKTTLIRSVSRLSDPEAPSPLTVVSSAPARYDARDFVLHLHALLCRAVRAQLDRRLAGHSPEGLEQTRLALTRKHKAWKRLRRVLVLVVLLAVTVTVGSALWHVWPPVLVEELRKLVLSPASVTTLPAERVAVVLMCSLVVASTVVVAADLVGAALLGAIRLVRRAVPTRQPDDHALLAALAERQLDRIRFLQTFTDGWSGKISMPLSGEATRTWQTQRAEQRQTYPEVVEEFRRFTEHIAERLKSLGLNDRVVISIDELDKIGEPEKAHEFVNDIKGIFDIPGCVFLVSVSDDALTTFERRGIAIRDAFDSAFSEMVHVEHFTLNESRNWINRRVLDVPEQFSALCHSLSGGLPRDLRRHVIEMLDLPTESVEPHLSTATNRLVRHELDRKAHAFASTARTLDSSPALSDLLAELVAIKETAHAAELVQLATRLLDIPRDQTHPLDVLRRQSGCFVLFCATILEIFDDTLSEQRMNTGFIETLAIARQQMAMDSQIAWRLLVKIRDGFGLNP